MFDELLKSTESTDPLLQHYGIIGIRKILGSDVDMMPLNTLPNFRTNVEMSLIDKCLSLLKQN